MRRRRQRDGAKEAFWRGHIEAHVRSGLTVREFCRQQGLAENLFYAWRRELAGRDQERASSPTATSEVAQSAEPPLPVAQVAAFTEVLVNAAAEPRFTAPPSQLEIVLANPRRIVIPAGFDSATLTAVLDLLEQRPC